MSEKEVPKAFLGPLAATPDAGVLAEVKRRREAEEGGAALLEKAHQEMAARREAAMAGVNITLNLHRQAWVRAGVSEVEADLMVERVRRAGNRQMAQARAKHDEAKTTLRQAAQQVEALVAQGVTPTDAHNAVADSLQPDRPKGADKDLLKAVAEARKKKGKKK